MEKVRNYFASTFFIMSIFINAWLCFVIFDTSITLHYARSQISFLEKDISNARDIIEVSFKDKSVNQLHELGIKLQSQGVLYKNHSLSEGEISIGEWVFVIKDDKVVSVEKE